MRVSGHERGWGIGVQRISVSQGTQTGGIYIISHLTARLIRFIPPNNRHIHKNCRIIHFSFISLYFFSGRKSPETKLQQTNIHLLFFIKKNYCTAIIHSVYREKLENCSLKRF